MSRLGDFDADVFLGAASLLCLLTLAIHLAIGGRETARVLLQTTDLPSVTRRTAYYCWHVVTIVLVAMAAAFVWAATDTSAWEAAALAAAISTAGAVLSLILATTGKGPASELPQWSLFSMIAGLGWIGLLGQE